MKKYVLITLITLSGTQLFGADPLDNVRALQARTAQIQAALVGTAPVATTTATTHNADDLAEAAPAPTPARKKKKKRDKRPTLDNDSIETIVNEHIATLSTLEVSLAEQLDAPQAFSSILADYLGTEEDKINGRQCPLAVIYNDEEGDAEERDTQGGLHRTIYRQLSFLEGAKGELKETRMKAILRNLTAFKESKERQLANWQTQDHIDTSRPVTYYIDNEHL